MFQPKSPISIASGGAAPAPAFEKRPAPRDYGDRRSSIIRYLIIAVAAAYLIVASYFMYFAYSVYEVRPRIIALEQRQTALEAQQAELNKKVHGRLTEFKQTMSTELGTTKQEMTLRAA